MSEAATESPTRARPAVAPSAGGNFFSKKYGPLPGWGWAALAAVGAVGYMYWRNRQNAAAAAAGGDTTGSAATDNSGAVTDDITGQLSTIQTEIEALQGEESSEGSSTGGSTSGTGGKPKYTRHTSQGNRSLNQIAKDNNTSVAHIVSLSKAAGESGTNLAKLEAWARKPGTRPKGVVWYT